MGADNMTLLVAADAAGLLDRAVEIVADAADTPTRQMQAGKRWLDKAVRAARRRADDL